MSTGQGDKFTLELWNGVRKVPARVIVANDPEVQQILTPVQFKGGVLGLDGSPVLDSIGITIDGGNLDIISGTKGRKLVPFTGTIKSWTLLASEVGSIVLDIKKSTYAGFPTTMSIVAADKPTLAGAQKNTSSALVGWDTAVTANDILEFSVDSATGIKQVTLVLTIQR